MRNTLLISLGVVSGLCNAQQQQLSNMMAFNMNQSNLAIQSNNLNVRRNVVFTNNVNRNPGNKNVQTNKVTASTVRGTTANSNSVRRNTNTLTRQTNRRNTSNVSGPNSNGNTGNFNENNNPVALVNDAQIQTNISDNSLGNSFDNNVENQINLQAQVLINDDIKVPIQQAAIPNQSFVNESKGNKSTDLSLDLSVSKKTFSSGSASSSSAKANRRTFQKKYSKLKRNFYGKIFAHKKSRHQVDICFNWR